MPKVNHGPEPKTAPPSLVVMLNHHRTLSDPLVRYADFQRCIDRAKVLEERLNDLHDAVEFAIEKLNEVAGWELEAEGGAGSGCEEGSFAEGKMQEALATLNRVL